MVKSWIGAEELRAMMDSRGRKGKKSQQENFGLWDAEVVRRRGGCGRVLPGPVGGDAAGSL